MKTILVNYIISENNSLIDIPRLVEACKSDKYNVVVNVLDYRQDTHKKESPLDQVPTLVNYESLSFEDLGDIRNYVADLLISNWAYAFINILPNVMPSNGFIDRMNIDIFDNQSFGAVYSDFYVTNDKKQLIYAAQKSMPVKVGLLPIVVFSKNFYISNMDKGNEVESFILSSSLCKHIPQALCTLS